MVRVSSTGCMERVGGFMKGGWGSNGYVEIKNMLSIKQCRVIPISYETYYPHCETGFFIPADLEFHWSISCDVLALW